MNNNLTQDVIPISYKVKLNTDFEDDNVKLDGNAEININVINSTDVIILRARNIIIKPDAHLKCDYPTIQPVISTIEPLDNITDLFKIILSNKLEVGSNCNLTFNYTRDDITSSTILSQFTGQQTDKTWVLASWNLACDVIPCPFDRTLKASFAISIEHNKNYTALSHMDAIKVETNSENPERIITHFAESPKMYPIHFAFLIGNFIKDDHNEKFQVFTTRNSSLSPNYIQEMGTKIMNALSNNTGVPYETFGLKTLKTIMGNLQLGVSGAAYYGYTFIDVRDTMEIFENSTSDSRTVKIILALAREMSNEWLMDFVYRNAVETEWFVKGITEYLSYVAVDQAQPTWRMMDQFVIYRLQYYAFINDATGGNNWAADYTKKSNENYYRIHVLNRAQLIDDAFSLAKAGQLDYKVVLSLLTYLKQESDPIPWAVAHENMEEMYIFVKNTKIGKYFEKYISELSEKLEQEMLSGQLNDIVLIMRGTKKRHLEWARSLKSTSGDPESTKKLINWLDDPEKNPLPAEKESSIICDALEHASQELWDKVWDQYKITNDSQLRYPMLCTKNITISRQYLLRSLPNNASRDEVISTFNNLEFIDDNIGITVIVDYIIEHYNKTNDLSDTLNYYLDDSWEFIIFMISDERQLNEVSTYLKTFIKANEASITGADEKIADIENKLKSSSKQLHEMTEFFEKYMTIDSNNSNSRPTEV
ncbi:hypothetical protein PV326_013321 [Microctonus aethiopoides]|nr:hypothetical protein PV326_013321 [Microctonus aethiopoides]